MFDKNDPRNSTYLEHYNKNPITMTAGYGMLKW